MEKSPTTCTWECDSHLSSKHSQWLRSTLAGLDEKTKAMLTLIQQDGDSFTPKKRPELVKMVEEFHRSYCSLAEHVNQLKFEYVLSQSSSLSSSKQYQYQNCSESRSSKQISHPTSPNLDPESVVEHPEFQGELTNQLPEEIKKEEPDLKFSDNQKQMAGIEKLENDLEAAKKPEGVFVVTEKRDPNSNSVKKGQELEIVNWKTGSCDYSIEEAEFEIFLEREQMWAELRLQVSKLIQENVTQQQELIRRNEEKRVIIKSLSSEVEKLMDENMALQKCLRCPSVSNKQQNPLQISKPKRNFLSKIWGGGWSKN